MLFENSDFDFSFFDIPGFDFKEKNMMKPREDKWLSAEEGFLRGNMRKDSYIPYKNYPVSRVIPKNEREKCLFEVMKYDFAVTELNLYLDLHPEDIETFTLFKEYVNKLDLAQKLFTEKFGPITVKEDKGSTFDWQKNPWPWDNEGGSMYV